MSFSICQRAPCKISIHALREEGDPSKPGVQARREPISIHALREEGDPGILLNYERRVLFLSTPSARRATYVILVLCILLKISIHALREEGDVLLCCLRIRPLISIHALREEGDVGTADKPAPYEDFYPRPPRGGRHRMSLHKTEKSLFLSTPSARRATYQPVFIQSSKIFLSTPSARRATERRLHRRLPCKISIHALREEGDVMAGPP